MGGTGNISTLIMEEKKKERASAKEYLQLKDIFSYFFRKNSGNKKADFTLKSMHFVNKFSMVVFLIAILYLVIKHMI